MLYTDREYAFHYKAAHHADLYSDANDLSVVFVSRAF